MTDLTALLERVEKAESASRELDGLIAKAFGELPAEAWWMTENVYGEDAEQWVSGGYGKYKFYEPEPYTASIDAALALVEKKLPGAEYDITTLYGIAGVELPLNDHNGPQTARRRDGNIPLAIIECLLRSLQHGGQS
jgi:hypothetical protein